MGRLEIPHSVQVPRGTIQIWDDLLANIPQNWLLCDGVFVTNGLVSHQKLDNDVLDNTGTNNGTVTGTTTFSTINKIVGSHAFDFNGSTRITLDGDVETNYDREITDAFTISFWFRGNGTGEEILFAKRTDNTSGSAGYSVTINASDDLVFEFSNGTTEYSVTSNAGDLRTNKMHLVTLSFSGNSNQNGMEIFLDGQFIIQGASTAMSTSILNNLFPTIGAGNAGASAFTGQIDDVRFYNKLLTIHDRRRLYLNPPDLTASFVRGVPTATTEPGTTGGGDTHILLTAELPSHTHVFSESEHTSGLGLPRGVSGSGNGSIDDGTAGTGGSGGTGTTNNATGASLQNLGSDSSHENRPAFFQEAYIIKV